MKPFTIFSSLIALLLFFNSIAVAQIFPSVKQQNRKPLNLSGLYQGNWKDLHDNVGEVEMKIYSMNNGTEYGGFFISTNSLGQVHTGSVEFQRENNYLKGYFNPTVYDRYDSVRSSFNCYLNIRGVFKNDEASGLVI